MQSIETNWEDEENNRQVAVAVEYTTQNDSIKIAKLTPKQVVFLCPESKSPLRSVGVWTEKGRELLAAQLRDSGHMAKIEQDIEASLAV